MQSKRSEKLSFKEAAKTKFILRLKLNGFLFQFIVCAILGIGATSIILRLQASLLALNVVLLSVILISFIFLVCYPLLKRQSVAEGMLLSWLIGMGACVSVFTLLPYMAVISEGFKLTSVDLESARIYLWILGLFVVPLALGLEQLIFAHIEVFSLERESEVAELDFRIRPHFMFNSLNSVASLIVVDPQQAEEGLMDLADMIRTVLTEKRRLVPFHLELEVAQKYMRLEQMRLGDRLQVIWQLDELDDKVLLPTLSLQPLLENAVYHGVESCVKGGKVIVSARQGKQYFYLSVTNPVAEDGDSLHKGNHIALENLQRRFQYLYRGDAAIRISKTSLDYTVNIKVPIYLNASNLPQ